IYYRTSRKKRYLLFLPLLLLVIVKESFASNESSDAHHENSELNSQAKPTERISPDVKKADATTISNLESETILHPQEDSFTTISDLSVKDDSLVTKNPANEESVPETTGVPDSANNLPRDVSGKDVSIRNGVNLKEAEKEEPIAKDEDGHSNDSNNLPSNILFKRILTSEDNSEPINLDEVPETRLDSWRPLWHEEHLASHALNPTAKFPDFNHPQNSYIESSFLAKPNAPETFAISKEPVTAYYFDLSSVLPTIPIGPLYDPSYLATAHHIFNTPESPHHETGIVDHDNPHLNLENTFVHPVHDESIYFPNEKEKVNIEPTPTLPDYVEEERETHSEAEKNHTEKRLEEEVPSMIKSDSSTVISLYNKTTDDLQNSTPAYTLGNSTDFKFTQNDQILPKNSTTISEVVNLTSSTLSSEIPMDLHSITGDPLTKDFNESATDDASLYKLPISPSELPGPISINSNGKSRVDLNLNPKFKVSRIPLWKRLSQTQEQTDTTGLTSHTSTPDNETVSPSIPLNTSIESSNVAFDNDLPIGIFSPGIFFTQPNQFSHEVSNNKEAVPVNLTSTTITHIDSSLHNSTESIKDFGNENIFPTSPPPAISDKKILDEGGNIVNTIHKSDLSSAVNTTSHSENISTTKNLSTVSVVTENTHVPNFINSTVAPSTNTSNSVTLLDLEISNFPNLDSIFSPIFTKTPTTTDSIHNTTSAPDLVSTHSSHPQLTDKVADKSFVKNAVHIAAEPNLKVSPETSEKESKIKPFVNEINHSSIFKTSIGNKSFEGNNIGLPSLFSNLNPSLKDLFNNSTAESSNIEDPFNQFSDMFGSNASGFQSNKTSSKDINNLKNTQEKKDENEPVKIEDKKSVKVTDSENINITDGIDTASHPPTETSTHGSHLPVESTTTTSSTTSTASTTTSTTSTTMSTTTTSKSTTSSTTSTSSSTTTEKPLTHDYIPENLEFIFPTNQSLPSNVTFYIPKGENNSFIAEEADEKPIKFVISENEGDEPVLKVITLHKNGTNTTEPTPYIKVAVSYNLLDFCQHNKNIQSLLQQWVTKHMTNFSQGDTFEIEVFHQPDCENLYIHPELFDELGNKTTLYFYVKQNGEISPNSTLHYPRNPTNLEISQELDYLKNRITHLELMNASTSEERLIEEAAVGTSIVVIVVVTTLLIVILISAILAFFVIKKRRAAESMHGRRCTPATTDAYSLDSVSVFYHSLRRKSKKRASNKSLKSYLNQGFDDPNLPSRPLNFNKLTHFISDNEAIYDEFSNIPTVVPKYDEMPKGVEDKNRYANVIPVPETRILLEDNKATPSEQYINAK
ncbi:hypothetical protein Anas_05649, partial [Armadillidium nasatum]